MLISIPPKFCMCTKENLRFSTDFRTGPGSSDYAKGHVYVQVPLTLSGDGSKGDLQTGHFGFEGERLVTQLLEETTTHWFFHSLSDWSCFASGNWLARVMKMVARCSECGVFVCFKF